MDLQALTPLILLSAIGYGIYKAIARRNPSPKKDKALLTVSGDKERMVGDDKTVRLEDGKLTVPKAIQITKHLNGSKHCKQNDGRSRRRRPSRKWDQGLEP